MEARYLTSIIVCTITVALTSEQKYEGVSSPLKVCSWSVSDSDYS
jgi:hypothetical protein